MDGRQPALDLLGEDGPVMRRTPLVVALVVVAALTAGCTSGDSSDPGADASTPIPSASGSPSADGSASPSASPSSTVVPATPAPRPARRACYRLGYADAVAPTTEVAAVDCARRHTSLTFRVGTVDAVVDGHLLAVDSRHVQDDIAAQCPAALDTFLGGTEDDRRLSMLRTVWFSPSIEQSDEGGNWFRCDVIALAGNEKLAPLTGRVAGALGRDGWQDRFGMCGTTDPQDADFERVICARRHAWRAIATIDAKGRDYPGAASLRGSGKAACEDPARAVAPDPLTVTWSYEPPTRAQWRSGQHYGICWVPTT